MRNMKIMSLLGLALLLTACGPIEWLNPCYREADLIFDSALVGRWREPENESTLRFQRSGDKAYELFYTEARADDAELQQSRFEAHLVRLGEYLFLDLLPEATRVNAGPFTFARVPSDDKSPLQPRLAEVGEGLYASLVPSQPASIESGEGAYTLHLRQAHWVFRIWLDGDNLRLAELSEDWLTEAVNQGKIDVGYEQVEGSPVVTASTEEIQAFLREYAGDRAAFPEPQEKWLLEK